MIAIVHSDEFTLLGTRKNLDWAERKLAGAFELKLRGRLGVKEGCIRDMKMLNRVVRLCKDGLRQEPDPRHTELLAKSIKLT